MKTRNSVIKNESKIDSWDRILQTVGIDHPHTPEGQALIRHLIRQAAQQVQFRKTKLALFKRLTPREKEILAKVAQGWSNPAIAAHFFIARNTVEQHRKNINRKLQTNQITVLIDYARGFGLV